MAPICRYPARRIVFVPESKGYLSKGLRCCYTALALIAMVSLLIACSGSKPAIPFETPAPETPGPLTPAEAAYYQAAQTDQRQLLDLQNTMRDQDIAHSLEATRLAQTPNAVDATWPPQAQTTALPMQTILAAAQARPAPERLRAIDVHFQAGIAQYQKALALYNQEFIGRSPAAPVLLQWEQEVRLANRELTTTLLLLDTFIIRHPRS